MCFVLKLDFPGKNNGTIKGDKCLVGQKRTHSFAQNVLKFGEKLLTAPESMAWGQRTRLTACQELCGCHLRGLDAKHSESSAQIGEPVFLPACSSP